LDHIAIQPGALFLGPGRTLCYHHTIVVPGETADALLADADHEAMAAIGNHVRLELERRAGGGEVLSFATLTSRLVAAMEDKGSGPEPWLVLTALDRSSLLQLEQAA